MGKDWIYDQISINTVSQFQTAHSYDNRALSRGNFREVLWLLFREDTAVLLFILFVAARDRVEQWVYIPQFQC